MINAYPKTSHITPYLTKSIFLLLHRQRRNESNTAIANFIVPLLVFDATSSFVTGERFGNASSRIGKGKVKQIFYKGLIAHEFINSVEMLSGRFR